jgi:FMN reductase
MSDPIRITVIGGSDREHSKTNMAAKWAVRLLQEYENVEIDYFDPLNLKLPFPGEDKYYKNVVKLHESLIAADGIILATPEYNGNISAALKLFLENFPWGDIRGKPYNVIGVAASRFGATKSIESVKTSCSHEGGVILPRNVSIGSSRHSFDSDGNLIDDFFLERMQRMVDEFIEYVVGRVE